MRAREESGYMVPPIPKPRVFRFEIFWMDHPDFMLKVQEGWAIPVPEMNIAN